MMRMRLFPIRLLHGWRAIALALTAAVLLPSAPAEAVKTLRLRDKPTVADSTKKNPLAFYLAKGEANACGRGCSEWIAVEGSFDSGAADRLRSLLKRNPAAAKFPVIFHSPGGEVMNAFAIGRIMRQRGMTASVGLTVPEVCAGGESDACREAKSSGKPVAARLFTVRGSCASACVWAVAGAKVREILPGALLGVHSYRQEISVTVRAGSLVSDERIRAYARERYRAYQQSARAAADNRTRSYLVEMGISPEVFALAATVPHDKIHFLTREEIIRFGFDASESRETRWTVVATQAAQKYAVKYFLEGKAAGNSQVQTSFLRAYCSLKNTVRIDYVRGQTGETRPSPGWVELAFDGRQVTMVKSSWGTNQDIQTSIAPFALIDQVAGAGQLSITQVFEKPDAKNDRRTLSLANDGLAEAIEALRPTCGGQAT